MAKSSRTAKPRTAAEADAPVDATLQEAFRTIEAQPVPDVLGEQIERLSTPPARPDRRS